MKYRIFFSKIAHEELLDLQFARIPPRQTNQESVRTGATGEAGSFRVEEKPFFWILQCGASFARERLVTRAEKSLDCCVRGVGKFRRGEPVSDGQVFAEMIPGNAGAEEPAERVCFVGHSNGGGARGDWPRGLLRGEPRKFIGSCSHLSTQPVENGEGGFFCARGEIAGGADAGRAALFASTGGNEFAGFLYEETVRSKEGFGKAYAAGVGIEEVQVWFEEFFGAGGDNVFHAGRSEIFNRAGKGRSMLRPYNGGSGFGIGGRRALADGGAEVAAVAHE